jgi:hypothetical protein
MNDFHEDDDPLLRPGPAATTPALKREVFDQTARVLRRRRVTRRVVWAAALAACYAAGVLTPKLRPSAAPTTTVEQVAKLQKVDKKSPLEPAPVQPAPSQADDVSTEPAELPAPALEQRVALANPQQRAQLYRQAGDRYLEEAKDVESALRCYRCSLDENADADLTISPDDNWLLMSVKNARMEEKRHALANE